MSNFVEIASQSRRVNRRSRAERRCRDLHACRRSLRARGTNEFSKSSSAKNPGKCAGAALLTGLGALGLVSVAFPLMLLGDYSYDGTVVDHELTEADGRYYADRYNRALLRKVVRDSERGRRQSGHYRAPRPPSAVQLFPGVFGFTF